MNHLLRAAQLLGVLLSVGPAFGQNSMDSLPLTTQARSRSITAENLTGEKGEGGMATEGERARAASDLGQGWKISPGIEIQPGQTFTIARIEGPGAIEHIWMTLGGQWRLAILRVYWDGEEQPSIEVPVGDFFASAFGQYDQISSLAVCDDPRSGLNSYWRMPFRRSAKVTIENLNENALKMAFQIDYELTDVPAQAAYFHAQFRRVNPLPYKTDYVILDGVKGQGQYVGTYLVWSPHNGGWWGEGELKFFLDGDQKFPTLVGTGTEDYFGGSYDFDVGEPPDVQYHGFSSPYSGLQVDRTDGHYRSQQRFGMYRWHIADPIRFEHDLRVTVQALGWGSDGRYLPLQDDIASVAFWYQIEPHAPFPKLPTRDVLEIH